MEKCIECKKNKIHVKKYKLCQKCYSKMRYSELKERQAKWREENYDALTKPTQEKIRHQSEIDFIKNNFSHQNWIYHPATFRFNGDKYQPDFYDGERNVFIEVAGTRQASHFNKEKYKAFTKYFPKINFEIRDVSGKIIDISAENFHINNNKLDIEK